MKKIIFVFISILCLGELAAQNDTTKTYKAPIFKSGKSDYFKFLNKNIHYPQMQVENGKEGKVDADIYISKTGQIKSVTVHGKTYEFNMEVKKALLLMPDWEPASLNNIPIDTMITQRIFFSIQNPNPENINKDFEVLVFIKEMTESEIKETQEKEKKWNQAKKLNDEANILYEKKQFSEALEKYNQAIELVGKQPQFLYNRAKVYFSLKQEDLGCKDLHDAFKMGDRDAEKAYNSFCK